MRADAPVVEPPGLERSVLPARPAWTWPGGARLAVTVVVVLDTILGDRARGLRPVPPGGMGARPEPDLARLSHHEYGLRVGVFRVLDRLDAAGLRPTVAIDLATARRRPYLTRLLRDRGDDVIAAGPSAGEPIAADAGVDEERVVSATLDGLAATLGRACVGWMGPGGAETLATPAVLAHAGVAFVCDWANDEQPYRIQTAAGPLVSLPVALELDTQHALWERRLPADVWADQVRRAGERLANDATRGPARLLVVVLRPWLVGQPFRVPALEAAVRALAALPAWHAPAGEVTRAAVDHLE